MTHSYIPLEQYRRKWIFNHKDLPVTEDDKIAIKPLSDKSAMDVWNRWISNKCSRAELFSKGDWAARSNSWVKADQWQSAWDSDDLSLPIMFAEHFDWPDETIIYFAYEKYQIIETNWRIFKENWKCFLFFDDGPILFSPKFKQAAWFQQDGQFQLGVRG